MNFGVQPPRPEQARWLPLAASTPEEAPVPKKPFGGKRAAPFKSGGGRKASSPRTAKGTPKKR